MFFKSLFYKEFCSGFTLLQEFKRTLVRATLKPSFPLRVFLSLFRGAFHFTVNTYIMARASSDIIKYAKLGDFEGLRRCVINIDVDTTTAKGNTALHVVSKKGYEDCVRLLVASGASLNIKNNLGCTPLHFAVMTNNHKIIAFLLKSGASTEISDNDGDLPIHIASKEGYLEATQMLCAHASPLNTQNNQGLVPLHLASTNGHMDVVRCLCVSGCDIEKPNNRGITADIMAFKHLHEKIGLLLSKIRISHLREGFINQFTPIEKPVPKQSVKFLGYEGVGKTTLIRSLNASYFVSFFSRSKSQSSGPVTGLSQPMRENRLEMEQTSRQTTRREFPDYQYTRGIELHQATVISSDITVWDFSGRATYHMVYDFFVGDAHSTYVIVFNLEESTEVQYSRCSFWLKFLQYRLRESDIKNKIRPRLILVGTHADSSRMHRDNQGNYINPYAEEMKDKLSEEFPEMIFHSKAILCDSHLPNSPGLMELKCAIADKTWICIENELWKSTGFLTNITQFVEDLRKEEEVFPVISWSDFVLKIHAQVNPLAGPQHITLVVQQLEIMGEIYHLKSNTMDAIILDMNWFCNEIIGQLLSRESLARTRLTGCFTEDDFQSFFISSPADKTLPLLEALEMCIQCENDGEIEYEFPCFNVIEELEGLWSADDERYKFPRGCYGGVRLKAQFHFLKMAFPRIQIQLRRMKHFCNDPEDDLYQWLNGSKYCSGNIESLITLKEEQEIEIKVRGPKELKLSCFNFLENLLGTVQQVLAQMLPNTAYERHILSSEDLRHHVEQPFIWSPDNIFTALSSPLTFNAILRNPNNGRDETVLQLIGFGSEEVRECITSADELPIEKLPMFCQRKIARLLDSKDASGRDWCVLAIKLELGNRIEYIEKKFQTSKTLTLLDLWRKSKKATVGKLIEALLDIEREDIAHIIMKSVPIIFPKTSQYDDIQRRVTYLLPSTRFNM